MKENILPKGATYGGEMWKIIKVSSLDELKISVENKNEISAGFSEEIIQYIIEHKEDNAKWFFSRREAERTVGNLMIRFMVEIKNIEILELY